MVGAAGLERRWRHCKAMTASLQIGGRLHAAGESVRQPEHHSLAFHDRCAGLRGLPPPEIYVGTSLESTIQDHITGHRSFDPWAPTYPGPGRGADRGSPRACTALQRPYRSPSPASTLRSVSQDGRVGSSNLNAVSIGQFIDVSGQDTVTRNADGLNNPTSLDASFGEIFAWQPTTLWAAVLNSGDRHQRRCQPVTRRIGAELRARTRS